MENFRTCAILISRQALRPHGKKAWVQKAIAAVRWVKKKRLCLLTSTGMQTWEMLLHLAKSRGVAQKIYIPSESDSDFRLQKQLVSDQFKLDPSISWFSPVSISNAGKSGKNYWRERDQEIVNAADVLIPISVRPGGSMEKWALKQQKAESLEVNRDFQVGYENKGSNVAYNLKLENLSPAILEVEDRYLIHWTRTPNGPWPTEKKGDYYAAVEKSAFYPRDAFRTLQNILETGKIAASSLHMPKNIPTVSFSGLSPASVVPLMKWRSRYRVMSFEPYGVGIERNLAETLGVLPVRYYKKGARPSDAVPWLLQSTGVKTNWNREEEYRHLGDFELKSLGREQLTCFCRRQNEADLIKKRYGVKAYYFER